VLQALIEPLIDTRGWDVTSSSTTPSMGPLEDTRIQLGEQPACSRALSLTADAHPCCMLLLQPA
jgi:hypothetical protein